MTEILEKNNKGVTGIRKRPSERSAFNNYGISTHLEDCLKDRSTGKPSAKQEIEIINERKELEKTAAEEFFEFTEKY